MSNPEPTRIWRGALVVPMDGPAPRTAADAVAALGQPRRADLRVVGDRITELGTDLDPVPGEVVHDAIDRVLLPGFVQGHVHFCQTLFRGLADDRPLLDWLRERIWPLEAAHDADSTRISAELSVAELLRGGTTAVWMFESVRHAEHSAVVAAASGLDATFGNCLMDLTGDGIPAELTTSHAEAMRISEALHRDWHGRIEPGGGRLRYAVTPRFVLSCSEALAREAAAFAATHGLLTHTHASEHPAEVAAVEQRFGRRYLEVLDDQGYLHPRAGLAHCVHLSPGEIDLLADRGGSVLHCPSANLTLGSGIARIAEFRARGIPVALGADGAPCNGRLSALTELRQAVLLQALAAGPGVWPAAAALWTATRGGALAIGRDDLGQLVPGARADFMLLDLGDPRLGSHQDQITRVVRSADERQIREVVVGGRIAVRDGELTSVDLDELGHRAEDSLRALLSRAGLAR